MIKLGQVYKRNRKWYVQPFAMTTTGLWIAVPPLTQLNKDDSRYRKGETALEALNASRHGVPVPADNEDLVGPMLALAGVKSWQAFVRNAKCVGLELDDSRLTLLPFRPMPRSKGALEGITEQAVILEANASPEQIGAAMEEAFAHCP